MIMGNRRVGLRHKRRIKQTESYRRTGPLGVVRQSEAVLKNDTGFPLA